MMVNLARGVDSKSRLIDDGSMRREVDLDLPVVPRAEQGPRLGELQLLVFAKLQWASKQSKAVQLTFPVPAAA